MESYEIFKNACAIRGRTIADVCKKAGWGIRSSDNWKKGHTPSVSVVLGLSKELNTTVEYLMGETDDIDATIKSPFSDMPQDEKELLQIYRELSAEGKGHILTTARVAFGNVDYRKKDAASVTA